MCIRDRDNNGETYNSNKVTATGLKENKTYYYSYDNGNGYTKPAEYTTKSTNNFSFAFVGDPQIGSSNELKGKDTKEFYDCLLYTSIFPFCVSLFIVVTGFKIQSYTGGILAAVIATIIYYIVEKRKKRRAV